MKKAGELMEVILYVQDMAVQVDFYRDTLGLKVKDPPGSQEFQDIYWVELDTGGCTLALHGGGRGDFGKDAPKIVFRVAGVPAIRDHLLQQGVPMGEIRTPAPGVQIADGLDPEGNRFSIESRE